MSKIVSALGAIHPQREYRGEKKGGVRRDVKEGRENNYQRDPGSQTYLPELRDDGSERLDLGWHLGQRTRARDAERIEDPDRFTESAAPN